MIMIILITITVIIITMTIMKQTIKTTDNDWQYSNDNNDGNYDN